MPVSHPPAPRPSWAGIPAEERRSGRRARLVESAFDLLSSQGETAVTVRAVCQQANLNARYFYESFNGLDSLLVAVYERTVTEMTARVLAVMQSPGDDTAADTRAVIDAIVTFIDEDRRRGSVLYTEALGNETLNRHRLETGRAVVEFVERTAGERHGQLPPGETIGRMGAAFLVAGFTGLLQAWLDGRIDVPRRQLVDDATALFVGLAETAGRIAEGRRPPG